MNTRNVFRLDQDGQETEISWDDLRKGDRFRLTGDDLCPTGLLTATCDPYRNKEGIWTVEHDDQGSDS